MKLPRQSEGSDSQFEAATYEGAVAAARSRLGDDAELRCWKVRRGGIFGFFARESFVAGTSAPSGIVVESVLEQHTAQDPASRFYPPKSSVTVIGQDKIPTPSLSDLAEATEDKVILGSLSESMFSQMLAEAEATLVRSSVSPKALEQSGRTDFADKEIMGDLKHAVESVGLSGRCLPEGMKVTLDGLQKAMARMPIPDPIPLSAGSLVAVIGTRHDGREAALALAKEMALDESAILTFEKSEVFRQRVSRRRQSSKSTILFFEMSLRSKNSDELRSSLEHLHPDYVLAAVPAAAKKSDVKLWLSRLGRVDSISLSSLSGTATPAELMGEWPVYFIDGEKATVLRWLVVVLKAILEERS